MSLELQSVAEQEDRRVPEDRAPEAVERALVKEKERFWTSYIRLGFLVLTGETLFVLVYFAATPGGPHRLALQAISALTFALAVCALIFVDRVARQPWRVMFSLVSILFAGAALTTAICLDGGLDSPLVVLIALPILSAALALPVTEVWICGMAALVEFAIVVLSNLHVESSNSDIAALSAFLVGTVALSLGAAVYHSRLERDEGRLMQELHRQARIDTLTGCLSYGVFYDELSVEVDRALRHGHALSLVIVDIDLFKSFNDARGHAAGDAALVQAGALIRRISRSIDAVARIGGDEFAVILPMTDLASARTLSERIIGAFDESDGSELRVSAGYAALDPLEPTSQKLFRDADRGLYHAKAHGRGRAATITDVGAVIAPHHRLGQELEDRVIGQADWTRLEESLRDSNRATAEASSIIDSLQSTSSVGFGYVDRDFRLVRINPVLAATNGGRVEDQIGRTVAEVVPALWPTLEPILRRVIDTGEPVVNWEVTDPTTTDPDRTHSWLANLNPVMVKGLVTGIAIVVIDITDRKQLEESQATLTSAVVRALAASVEMRDPYTAGHQERVAQLAVAIANELGLDTSEIDQISLAARIHDIGKLSVPAELLTRPGRLSDTEMAVVRMHCQAGFDMLKKVAFPDHVAEMILQHHERSDGSGYPYGLRGDQIALGSRIIAVADVVESMASTRPYRAALGVDAALDEIRSGAGTRFDPDVVRACVRLVAGGTVRFDEEGSLVPACGLGPLPSPPRPGRS
ncbi:MAG: HD domain-containing phosphohydrolase [Acidimicrobiales bacterium]|jgi:diguanylate cyclase (GGDEF)-like protein/PAS domain S-box-containing protein/putative nucleotidyltransferase with HDIG domain